MSSDNHLKVSSNFLTNLMEAWTFFERAIVVTWIMIAMLVLDVRVQVPVLVEHATDAAVVGFVLVERHSIAVNAKKGVSKEFY